MAYSKTNPRANYALANNLITLDELNAVSEFIKAFKLKYKRRKPLKNKKKVL